MCLGKRSNVKKVDIKCEHFIEIKNRYLFIVKQKTIKYKSIFFTIYLFISTS